MQQPMRNTFPPLALFFQLSGCGSLGQRSRDAPPWRLDQMLHYYQYDHTIIIIIINITIIMLYIYIYI